MKKNQTNNNNTTTATTATTLLPSTPDRNDGGCRAADCPYLAHMDHVGHRGTARYLGHDRSFAEEWTSEGSRQYHAGLKWVTLTPVVLISFSVPMTFHFNPV